MQGSSHQDLMILPFLDVHDHSRWWGDHLLPPVIRWRNERGVNEETSHGELKWNELWSFCFEMSWVSFPLSLLIFLNRVGVNYETRHRRWIIIRSSRCLFIIININISFPPHTWGLWWFLVDILLLTIHSDDNDFCECVVCLCCDESLVVHVDCWLPLLEIFEYPSILHNLIADHMVVWPEGLLSTSFSETPLEERRMRIGMHAWFAKRSVIIKWSVCNACNFHEQKMH